MGWGCGAQHQVVATQGTCSQRHLEEMPWAYSRQTRAREREKVKGGETEFPKKLDSSSAAYCTTLADLVLRVAKSTEESTVL